MQNPPKKIKKPWPTKKAMEQIYDQNLWGTNNTKFYSGFGSHHPAIVNPYVEVVEQFLTSFDEKITVLDVGCGDFNIGSQLACLFIEPKRVYSLAIFTRVGSDINFVRIRFEHTHGHQGAKDT